MKSAKSGTVYYRDVRAGTLTRDETGYSFRYADDYFVNSALPAVSATLPKTQIEYKSKVLFPFFYGLLAEGVQKERQCRELKIDEKDAFSRLIETSSCGAIGAVYVTA